MRRALAIMIVLDAVSGSSMPALSGEIVGCWRPTHAKLNGFAEACFQSNDFVAFATCQGCGLTSSDGTPVRSEAFVECRQYRHTGGGAAFAIGLPGFAMDGFVRDRHLLETVQREKEWYYAARRKTQRTGPNELPMVDGGPAFERQFSCKALLSSENTELKINGRNCPLFSDWVRSEQSLSFASGGCLAPPDHYNTKPAANPARQMRSP